MDGIRTGLHFHELFATFIGVKKTFIILATITCLGFFVLPNLFNEREESAFSPEYRLNQLRERFPDIHQMDTVRTGISSFYERGPLIHFLFGEEYRELWNTPVSFPVWKNGINSPLLTPDDPGGGDQTISIDLVGQDGLTYTLRSVEKDQSRALAKWLRWTLARPVFRDQASSLNPYAAPVVSALAGFAGIPHTRPVLYLIPDLENFSTLQRELLAGRVMLMEEEPDESWNFTERFGTTVRLLDTKEMLESRRSGEFWVDSLSFARCRIFDVVIGDWDRHEGQWAWACDTLTGECSPLPVDRDMAFYDFHGGAIDALALQLVPKFQSFDTVMNNLEGYSVNGGRLQDVLLANLTAEQWQQAAQSLRDSLTHDEIRKAMGNYPPEVYERYGANHEHILRYRLRATDRIAHYFWESISLQPSSN